MLFVLELLVLTNIPWPQDMLSPWDCKVSIAFPPPLSVRAEEVKGRMAAVCTGILPFVILSVLQWRWGVIIAGRAHAWGLHPWPIWHFEMLLLHITTTRVVLFLRLLSRHWGDRPSWCRYISNLVISGVKRNQDFQNFIIYTSELIHLQYWAKFLILTLARSPIFVFKPVKDAVDPDFSKFCPMIKVWLKKMNSNISGQKQTSYKSL